MGLVAVDGTKMAAPASMTRNRSKDSIDKAVDEMFADAKAVDAAEDAEHGSDRGDEPPAVLRGRADRQRRFKQAKQRLDAELEAERAAHAEHLARRSTERPSAVPSFAAASRRHPRTRRGTSRRRSTQPIRSRG